MGKYLIITEKPSVARDYAKILGVKGTGKGKIENEKLIITWCVGHLVEMLYPESYDEKLRKWSLETIPFLPQEYKYGVIDSVKEQFQTVSELLNREDVERIYYAGDSGREGQVIMELIRRQAGVRQGAEELRVWIDSFTEEEIKRGLREAKPMDAYDSLGKAGILRGIEDYAMGINFSRGLSLRYGSLINNGAGTSKYTTIAIGRVMTCVLAMVVRREREIRDFVEQPFFRVIGKNNLGKAEEETSEKMASKAKDQEANPHERDVEDYDSDERDKDITDVLELEWHLQEGSKYAESPYLYKENGFTREDKAEELKSFLVGKEAVVKESKKSKEKKNPPLLFNLAELQSHCSKVFKISPDETLKIAQELYEKKLITYPRTDARVLSSAVAKEIEKNLKGLSAIPFVKPYIDDIIGGKSLDKLSKSQYVNDSKITDHYAIIPTGETGALKSLNELSKNVYKAIIGRFLAIFSEAKVYRKVNLVVSVDSEELSANLKLLENRGYEKIYEDFGLTKSKGREMDHEAEKERLSIVEKLKKGSKLSIDDYAIKAGKTSPPKRYTTGNLILAMENAGKLIEDEELRAQIKGAGIGTSATRAGIIDKLIRIKYLVLNKKNQIVMPSLFGELVYEVAEVVMPSMLNPEMTASWEKGLSQVENEEISTELYREKLEAYVSKYVDRIKHTDFRRYLIPKIRELKETYEKS